MLGRAPFQKKPRFGPIACGLAHIRAERLNPTTVASALRHALIYRASTSKREPTEAVGYAAGLDAQAYARGRRPLAAESR